MNGIPQMLFTSVLFADLDGGYKMQKKNSGDIALGYIKKIIYTHSCTFMRWSSRVVSGAEKETLVVVVSFVIYFFLHQSYV